MVLRKVQCTRKHNIPYFVDSTWLDTDGLAANYPFSRHKLEHKSNAGCLQARLDWIKHVGPVSEFGACNPINGNLIAVILPYCVPERLYAAAYVTECEAPCSVD